MQVSPTGQVSPIVTGGRRDACCTLPAAIALDGLDNLYVSNIHPPQVWFFNRATSPVIAQGRRVEPGAAVVVAGNGTPGFGGDGGPAVEAQLRRPAGLAVDRQGNLYIADAGENSVRRVDKSGTISTAVGTGTPGFNGDGYKGPLTQLNLPLDVAVDNCGNVLIADKGNDRIRRLQVARSCPTP